MEQTSKRLCDWIAYATGSDREALEDFAEDYDQNDRFTSHEILELLLRWHGYGMSIHRLRNLAIDYLEFDIED